MFVVFPNTRTTPKLFATGELEQFESNIKTPGFIVLFKFLFETGLLEFKLPIVLLIIVLILSVASPMAACTADIASIGDSRCDSS